MGESMHNNFDFCLEHILAYEGGYSDHPSDPGGATNMGITHITLRDWRNEPVTVEDVKALKRDEVAAIYKARYWDAARCGELPNGLDLAVFDCAVNQGVGRAVKLLQAALGVTIDGALGNVETMPAIAKANIDTLLTEFFSLRMNAYGRLVQLFQTFGLGWSRRLMSTHFASLSLALGQPKALQPRPQSRELITAPQQPERQPQMQPNSAIPGATAIDAIFGGGLLFGRKTILGIAGYLIVYFGSKLGIAPGFLTPEMVEMLTSALLGLAGLGAASKAARIESKLDEAKKDAFAAK